MSTAFESRRAGPGGPANESHRQVSQSADTMDSKDESSAILARIAAGDSEAVDACLEQYGGLVWSLANRYCQSRADAEDACQDIFLELWRVASRFDAAKASEATFISMIARRRLIDRGRRNQASPSAVSIQDAELDFASSGDVDSLEISDEADKATRCLKKLSFNQREILTLSIHQGEPQSSIAKILNMPLGSVKSYARRGLLQLRECMKRPLAPEGT